MSSRHRHPEHPPATLAAPQQPVGELLTDTHHIRSDARTLAQYIALGVVPESKAKAYLERTYDLLSDEGLSVREFTALSKVVVALAKLGIDIEKLDKPRQHQHAHVHAHASIDAGRHRTSEILTSLGAPGYSGAHSEARPGSG